MLISYRVLSALCPLLLALTLFSFSPGDASRITRGPYLQPGPAGGVSIVWYTETPTVAHLQWRPEGGLWEDAFEGGEPTTRHEVSLTELREATPYSYRIMDANLPLATVSAESQFSFRTPQPGLLKFAAFGDSGAATVHQRTITQSILRESPPVDMVLLTGDVIYPAGSDSDYNEKFFAPYAPLLSRVPFYSAIGNHDYESEGGAPYLRVFSLPRNGPAALVPETVYAFERDGVLFTVHDSNLSRAQMREYVVPWHLATVRASRSRFRIAALHHSPYSSAMNSITTTCANVREVVAPLFTGSGIDLVLGGHDHAYERSRPVDGVVYITTGAGGASMYSRIAINDYSELFYGEGQKHSYTTVEVSGANLLLRQTDTAGCVVDRVGLYKPIGEGDSWRIFRGTAAPPSDWYQPGFQDRGWTEAGVPIGYGRPEMDLTERIPDMEGNFLTLYARTTFTLGVGKVNYALLRLRYDDGFVAYLNGVEVARRNVPERQNYQTPASAAHGGDFFETFKIPVTNLRVGTNVLAIEGHNLTLRGSDFVLGPELTLVGAEPGRCN